MRSFEKVIEDIDGETDSIIELAQSLIKKPSVVGHEGKCQKFIINILEEIGLKVIAQEPEIDLISKHPEFSSWSGFEDENVQGYKNRPNVVGFLTGKGGGKSLILNGHIDVVPVLRPEDWSYDPWGACIVGDKLFGRGALDMKGGIAAMIMAVKYIMKNDIHLKGDLIVESVVDEEGGGNGTLDCFLRGYSGDAVFYPEPSQITGAGAYWFVCGGLEGFRIRIFGKSGHPRVSFGKSVNSVIETTKIIKAIEEFNHFRKNECKGSVDPEVAHLYDNVGKEGMVSIGSIRAGRWFSVMPDECILEGAIWYYPGEDIEKIKRDFINYIENCDLELNDRPPVVEWMGTHISPDRPVSDERFLKITHECVEKVMNMKPNPKGMLGGSDQRIFSNYAKIPTFEFGPSGGNIHANDEFVYIPSLIDVTKIITLTILNWCGVY
jgi:acetylornithine deacetylase